MINKWQKAINFLKRGGVVILPTDTLYGITATVNFKKSIEKIHKIKSRSLDKPFIILINSYKHLEIFGIKINKNEFQTLKKIWPGKVSIILPCKSKKWQYLHRGTNSIAFRMISHRNKNLFNLINKVGPIVAPSVNPEGEKPAETIREAKKYFGDKIDLYINKGRIKTLPSTLIRLENENFVILRQGVTKIKIK
jgi:L-threonylcarbamoyladenylate synthase